MTAPTIARPARGGSEASLWARHGDGDARAREELVRRFSPLARMLARRYSHTSEPLDDLEQVAYVGLLNAIDRFDPGRNLAFSTFAVPTILGEIRRYFRDKTWPMRVPRDLRDSSILVHRAADELAAKLGRSPSAAELAEAIGMSVEDVLEARQAARAYRCDSLDRPIDAADDEPTTLGDAVGVEDAELERVEHDVLLEQIASVALTPRERKVLRMRAKGDMLQREIAAHIGVSQMQVSRMLRDSIARLQATVEEQRGA